MLTWIKRTFRKAVNAFASGVAFTMAGIPLSRLQNYEDYLKAGCRKVWAAWKACDITANSVSSTPFVVARVGSTKPVKIQELDRLLTYPNENQTMRELVYLTVMHLKLTGSAFWYKAEVTLRGDKPRSIFPLNPKRIRIVPNKATGEVRGYLYEGDGVRIPFDPQEIIHFKRPHPNNDWWGLGDVEAGEPLFNESIHRTNWRRRFWRNGAAPSGVMITEDMIEDEQEFDKAKQRFHQEYGGEENSGKIAWLTGKWKYEQLGLTAAEMQDIESEKWNVEQLFLLHGVPLSVAGIRDSANYATADIDNQRFKEYTVLPLVLMIQDTINTDLIAGWGDNLKLTFNVSGLINIGKALQDLVPGFDRGIFSINEVRAMLKLETAPDNPLWNQHFLNAGLVPLELAGVADLQQVDEQAQATVRRFVTQALATKRNDPNEDENQPIQAGESED